MAYSVDDIVGGDLSGLTGKAEARDFLRDLRDRSDARLNPFRPITPEDRFRFFERVGFRPHGLYLPDDLDLRSRIQGALDRIGEIPDVDARLTRYYDLQARTGALEARGVAGRWIGQQAWARSRARFRLVAVGRRGGKTTYAAAEAVGAMIERPGTKVWLVAPVMEPLVARGFTIVAALLDKVGAKMVVRRDSAQHKLIVLDNGSAIEGVSMENRLSAAGDSVDLAVVDEAAQIDAEDWYRAIVPPLTDRNGQALLISSYEGAEGFFYDKARTAEKEQSGRWEVFEDASYRVNFYVFPQGRRTAAIRDAEADTPPQDFLEQYGGVAMLNRGLVYPEFRERVHVGSFPFDPEHEVVLAADPSGGAVHYAVAAIQDYGEYVVVVDEFWEQRATVEQIAPILDKRPWRANVVQMVVDSALPAEVERWIKLGYPAFPVTEKPRVPERLPFHRNALRDPGRFQQLYRRLVNRVLDEMGLEPDADLEMPEREQQLVQLQVEELLSDSRISRQDIDHLRFCSRLFIDRRCVGTITEHRKYKFPKKRIVGANSLREMPLDQDNDMMDALGYYFWQFKRFDSRFRGGEMDYVGPVRTFAPPDEGVAGRDPLPEIRSGFLLAAREMHAGRAGRVIDFMEAV